MIRSNALVEGLEGRQLFAGVAVSLLPNPSGRPPQPAVQMPRFPKASDAVESAAPIANYVGTVTPVEGEPKRFGLAIISETAGVVVARIPGREGGVKLEGTKTGNTYNLSAAKDGRTVTVVATVDADGNVTGTITHTFTNDAGETETGTGTLALKKATAPTRPEKPSDDTVVGGGGDDETPGETPAKPIAAYNGTVTFDGEERSKRFGVSIVSETDGVVVARLPGRGGAHELTGTKSGSTYTLASEDGKVSVVFTVADDGTAAGTLTCKFKGEGDTTVTKTGALSLKSVDVSTLPTEGEHRGDKPVRPFRPDRGGAITDAVVYTGTITNGERTGDVFVQTFKNKEGKTMVLIAAKHRFGPRPAFLEAVVTDTSITASKSVEDRSIDVAFTLAADGSLTGTVTLKRGDKTETLTIDADKKVTTTTAV